jgi:dTDP-glucose 4,6-dehydratase
MKKRVLVTGAGGFIGSHLVQRLVAKGANVRAMTHYRSDPSIHNLEFLTPDEMACVDVIKGNVEDPYFVRHAVEGCDVVFHLAALIAIPYSYIAPASYVATNIHGTLNVLEACRSEGTPRLVHTSTSECYGTAKYTPIDEKHPLQGQSPYSASKIGADKIVESYYRSLDLPVVTIRPFNTFGPRQSTRAVIPTIISQLAAGVKTLKLGALSPVRDFTFVTDTAEGLICGALAEGVEGEVINLGVAKGITIGKLAEEIMKLVEVIVPIETKEQRLRPEKSEVMTLISDNRKAEKKLRWRPQVSLEDGLAKTIEFIHQHLELLRADKYGV